MEMNTNGFQVDYKSCNFRQNLLVHYTENNLRDARSDPLLVSHNEQNDNKSTAHLSQLELSGKFVVGLTAKR